MHPGPEAKGSGGLALGGIDCSDGLARCSGGMVEVSRAYHVPDPCHGPEERCRCPWERIDECPQGCAADGVELDLPREEAVKQLCVPSEPVSLPLVEAGAPPLTACDGEGSAERYRCEQSKVLMCGTPPPQFIASCTRGCRREGEALDEEDLPSQAAVLLLCRH